MIRKFIRLIVLFIILSSSLLRADEGMWIPVLMEKFNIEIMKEKGFKLSAEDIYSINKASMKDAVMIFGGGCTAELISDRGLLITNHHCGYRSIQSHSTVDNDYLTNGFWAMSQEEELTNPGLTVTFLKWMKDVTGEVLKGIEDGMSEEEMSDIKQENIDRINEEAIEGTHFTAQVKPFYYGNQYFLFVNETYKDVRLVGAPPSAIGKFGGDTDNWMWPRHTGDFSLFRIYAGKENEPVGYSPDNVPFKPEKFFPISLKGTEPGDFTMVFGYPGSTYEYVPSFHLQMLTRDIYPELIDVRTKKLEIMQNAMEKSRIVRIQYSAKAAGVSNSWKRWKGEIRGLDKLDAIAKKQAYEERFREWTHEDSERNQLYGNLLSRYDKVYNEIAPVRLARSYFREVFFYNGVENISLASGFSKLVSLVGNNASPEEIDEVLESLRKRVSGFFKNYDPATGDALSVAMLLLFEENVPWKYHPEEFKRIMEKFDGNYQAWIEKVRKKSLFVNEKTLLEFLNSFKSSGVKKIEKDPIFRLAQSAGETYNGILSDYGELNQELVSLHRVYMKAQMEFEPGKLFYPDANFSLRVSYGEAKGYEPRDAVFYKHYTTLEGVMEKDDPAIYDYNVPEKLRELYRKKDYGRYAPDGKMPVCFLATNHTTGGNSGSPVINAEGHLIGINFDRAWEGVMSDLMFNPEQCRNISLDIRYALFIIDKFAGAGYLLDEMTLVE
ncbi:MAG: S46 family peptidase [Bacteroidetes bacterium]|nr:S46 family peptidase [Bacteroidota bacterium]